MLEIKGRFFLAYVVRFKNKYVFKLYFQLEHGVRPHSKYLMEYFAFLYEFAKMGDQECFFLLQINAISTMVSFYMGQKAQENYVRIQC